MRFNAKPLILLIIILLAMPVLALLGFNLILQLPSVQNRIQSSIEKSVGMPISIGGISVTSGGDIKAQGVSSRGEGSPSFALESLVIHPFFLKLLQGEVVIHCISIHHPVLRYSVAESGVKSSFSQKSNNPVSDSIQQTAVQIITSTSLPSAPPLNNISSIQSSLFPGLRELPRLKIIDGEFLLLDERNIPLVSAQGINLTDTELSAGGWRGSLTAKQITLGSSLIIHELSSPIIVSPDAASISLNDLTATLGGGKLAGNLSVDLPPSTPEFKTQLTLSGATLNQFFLDASLGNAATEGVVTGNLQLSGIAGIPQSTEGQGALLCTDAVIQPADFLKQIGQILQIQELQLLRLAEGKTLFRVQHGDVQIDQLALRSENLILTAQGPVHSNGDLDLQARLLFNEKLSGRLHGFLGPQLTQAPEPGYSQVAFHVSGPAKSPKTDLLERLTGIRINGDLGGLLQGLFGRPSNH